MKTLKSIFFLFLFSTIVYSCTPEETEDYSTNTIDNTQATGDDSATTDDGSKD
ncbi:hypothetical protein [Aquimarina intermedia]|uniref:Uncharacterized protein n=1 Tax=Aquimarina intermedia TaxID=350814 RepID=A0A5S5C4Y0_9FLAO|nr:hypothetical protein [Aquimarina intermedia]TYP74367.1 hypothetical protein BD809_104187 [Aquimarina intermedia]